MSEVSHFFAALVADLPMFRKSLERTRVQEILDPADPESSTPQGPQVPVLDNHWVAFASPSGNLEVLRKLTGHLVEIFDESGDWSVGFFTEREQFTLHSKELETRCEDSGMTARQQEWLQRFLGRSPTPTHTAAQQEFTRCGGFVATCVPTTWHLDSSRRQPCSA